MCHSFLEDWKTQILCIQILVLAASSCVKIFMTAKVLSIKEIEIIVRYSINPFEGIIS